MSVDWNAVLSTVGSTAVIIAVLGWLARTGVGYVIGKDVAHHKAVLEQVAAAERIRLEDAAASRQAHEAVAITRDEARDERVRLEVERWANPILGAVRDLQSRVTTIVEYRGFVALSADGPAPPPDWSIDYEYYLPSTVYLFAQYFCWIRLLQERLTFDLTGSPNAKDEFFIGMLEVSRSLSAWPLEATEDAPEGTDRQIFWLQQRRIGEAVMQGAAADVQCMRFAEFMRRWPDPNFQAEFRPLPEFLEGIAPDTRRWVRLRLMLERLEVFAKACEEVLSPRRGSVPADRDGR